MLYSIETQKNCLERLDYKKPEGIVCDSIKIHIVGRV